ADGCRATPGVAAPEIAPPWTPVASPDAWRPAAANPDAEVWQRYRSGDRAIDLYVGFYCAQREGAEAVSEAHRLSGAQPWVVLAQGQDRLEGGAGQLPVQRLAVRSGARTGLVYLGYWVDGRFTADPLAAKLLQAKAALLGGPDAAAVIVLSSPYDAEPSSARASVEQALVALEPLPGFLMRLGGAAEASARR
ncbi:MAG: exosortase C-terminal domain/associated protein EpsI, partial [Geminicoccaceae bacterium]